MPVCLVPSLRNNYFRNFACLKFTLKIPANHLKSIIKIRSYNDIIMTVFIFEVYDRSRLFGPRQSNLVLIAYASSEGSGEPAHPRSLARTFAARSYKQ